LGKFNNEKRDRPLLVTLSSVESKLVLFKNIHRIRELTEYEKVNVSIGFRQIQKLLSCFLLTSFHSFHLWQLSLLPFWPSWIWCFVCLHLLYPRCSQLFPVHLVRTTTVQNAWVKPRLNMKYLVSQTLCGFSRASLLSLFVLINLRCIMQGFFALYQIIVLVCKL
jgi:hypothetical protein